MTSCSPVPTSATLAPPRRPVPAAFVALMYHNICRDQGDYPDLSPSATSYFVTESDFGAQLAALVASGASGMTWDDLVAFYGASRDSGCPVRPLKLQPLLTFDDGWKEAVDLGEPILERYRCKAFVFITSDFLGRPHFMSRRDVSKLDPHRFRVGSHARTHRMLNLLSEREIRGELSESKKLLEDLAGYEVDALSIPSGAVDRSVRRIASECGYRFVFDSEVRINRRDDPPSAIGRVPIKRKTSLGTFRRYLQCRIAREQLRRAVLSAPKRVLGLRCYERLRRHLLGEKQGQHVTHQS